jgi:hypothetical protein
MSLALSAKSLPLQTGVNIIIYNIVYRPFFGLHTSMCEPGISDVFITILFLTNKIKIVSLGRPETL